MAKSVMAQLLYDYRDHDKSKGFEVSIVQKSALMITELMINVAWTRFDLYDRHTWPEVERCMVNIAEDRQISQPYLVLLRNGDMMTTTFWQSDAMNHLECDHKLIQDVHDIVYYTDVDSFKPS